MELETGMSILQDPPTLPNETAVKIYQTQIWTIFLKFLLKSILLVVQPSIKPLYVLNNIFQTAFDLN